MTVAGFFILLGLSIVLRLIGNKLLPLVMPAAKMRTIAAGWLGGLIGSLFDRAVWQLGPEISSINIIAAAIGCSLAIIILGVAPFIKIALGKYH